jgi:hypothetical protein
MAKLLKFRIGVADDPTALQPSLNDCLEAVLQQSDLLIQDVIKGLVAASLPTAPRRIAGLQLPGTIAVIQQLSVGVAAVAHDWHEVLTRIVYEGGGKEQVATEALRFEDLRLFEESQIDQSIEVARALQEVSHAVDDVLPALDALVSTLLGWRTIQPGLNPLRPDAFVRALQEVLAIRIPDASIREDLIAPAAGLLGTNLNRVYRELCDWLRSTGVEPAVPLGGRVHQGAGALGKPVADSVAKTLLTLDRLRKLLAGDFDAPGGPRQDFMYTVPASMAMLQEMKGVDALVKKLQDRPKPPPAEPVERDMLAEPKPASDVPRIGLQLGEEVVRLMFENLERDKRLLPEFKRHLLSMEPALVKLAKQDSRFFSDRTHPARQFLEKMTQRSLAFTQDTDPGWRRFVLSVEDAVRWLGSKVVDADTFGELMDHLQEQWTEHDETVRERREDAARALLHAEQRNLLAQKLAVEFAQAAEGLGVPDFVLDFVKSSWSQVVAEAQLSCADGSDDPYGYRALVDDLIWSVQKTTAQRGRGKRLVHMIPALLAKLREGLERIQYPPELTARFFNNLITIHRAAVHEGRDPTSRAAAEAAEGQPSAFAGTPEEEAAMWLDNRESEDSGFIPEEALSAEKPAAADLEQQQPPGPVRPGEWHTGTWVEILIKGEWVRAQLTWASPHGTLYMFTAQVGTAHSMSRRSLDRLLATGHLRIVAERNIVDEALDQVAKTALQNSVEGKEGH